MTGSVMTGGVPGSVPFLDLPGVNNGLREEFDLLGIPWPIRRG